MGTGVSFLANIPLRARKVFFLPFMLDFFFFIPFSALLEYDIAIAMITEEANEGRKKKILNDANKVASMTFLNM